MCFLVSLLFVASFCNADAKTVKVVGAGECADCAENNLEISQAFSGTYFDRLLMRACMHAYIASASSSRTTGLHYFCIMWGLLCY